MSKIVISLMMGFMVLGAVDKALLGGRLGYGEEFEKGICAIGPLTIMMAGIMCIAPALGNLLAPALSPVFRLIGADPGMAGGMFFAIDMGGFPLVQRMTEDRDIWLLSGILLGSTMGAAVTFVIPVGLEMCPKEKQSAAAKGIVAGVIAAPVSALVGGLLAGIPGGKLFANILPAVLMALLLAAALTFLQKPVIGFFMGFSRVLSALGVLWLAAAILEELLGLVVIPGMAPLGEQLVLIGEIGITLAGAYPLVKFVRKLLAPALSGIAGLLRADENSACGMLVSIANPLPAFDLAGKMGSRGIVLVFAFLTPACAVLGDHLGYVSAVYPEAITPMLCGKLAGAACGLVLALLITRDSEAYGQVAAKGE